MLDRIKEIEFKKVGDNVLMYHMGQELALYIGMNKIEVAERYFRRPILPKWKMEKVVYQDLPVSKLKLSENLPHQCKCGEVCDGQLFLHHLQIKHRSICPAGTLLNAWPHRFWLPWYDDRNFLRFHNTVGRPPNYIKAGPPWIDESI